MIDLTPLEVRQKKGDFRRVMRGYDADLVNDFLDLVADRMEELVKENMGLRDRVESLEAELERFRAKEKSLTEALVSSQELREDAQKQAERKADMVLREAELRAREREEQAATTLAREELEIRRLKARRAQLVRSFRQFLERELAELDIVEETLELKDAEGLEEWGAEAVDAVRTVAADASASVAHEKKEGPAASPEPDSAPAARAEVEAEPEPPVEAEAGPSAEAGPEAEPEPEEPEPAGDAAARAVDAEGPLLGDPEEERRFAEGLPPLGPEAPEDETELGAGSGGEAEDDEEQTDWLSSIVEERD